MSLAEQFSYRDRNPANPGFDLMPDLPILLRSPPHTLSGLALVDSGATIGVLPYSLGLQLGFVRADSSRFVPRLLPETLEWRPLRLL